MTAIETRPSANLLAIPKAAAPGGAEDTRSAMRKAVPSSGPPDGADTRQAISVPVSIDVPPAGDNARPTNGSPMPRKGASGGVDSVGRQRDSDDQASFAASAERTDRQDDDDAPLLVAVGQPGPAATGPASPIPVTLLDPALSLAADVLDDIERVRIANENRLRQLTRSEEDSDGEIRGFGLTDDHPDVARLGAIVDTLAKVEHDATLQLQRQLRRHLLGPWMKAQKGIGEKQGARLLAAIGDPYIRPQIVREDGTVLPAGPRTVSALWAYCGFHTLPVDGHGRTDAQSLHAVDGANLPAGQPPSDAQALPAGRGQLAGRHPDQVEVDDQQRNVWVAARRQRGTKANWSTKAKMRAYLIAESCLKAGGPYRDVYDRRKAATEGHTHAAPCAPCGSKGKPAQPGTDWRDGHRHADALRITAKEILKGLWRESRRIHTGGTA